MKKYDFKKIEINEINGKIVDFGDTNISKIIGEALYNFSTHIDIAEIGKRIYEGKVVELRDEDISKIKEIINNDKMFHYSGIIIRNVLEFLK